MARFTSQSHKSSTAAAGTGKRAPAGGRNAKLKASETGTAERSYRDGVGIVLINDRNEVFVARRVDVDVRDEAWQMPQGGILAGEKPVDAALRELREEIGTDNVAILAESARWFSYEVPPQVAEKTWKGRWQGQRQKWFVLQFKGTDSDIDLATKHPEFNAWRWVPAYEVPALAVSFKRQLYLDVFGEFSTIFRD